MRMMFRSDSPRAQAEKWAAALLLVHYPLEIMRETMRRGEISQISANGLSESAMRRSLQTYSLIHGRSLRRR